MHRAAAALVLVCIPVPYSTQLTDGITSRASCRKHSVHFGHSPTATNLTLGKCGWQLSNKTRTACKLRRTGQSTAPNGEAPSASVRDSASGVAERARHRWG